MTVEYFKLSDRTMMSRFEVADGSGEYFILTRSKMEDTIEASLANVARDYKRVMNRFGIDRGSLVFARFILSDIENMKDGLRESELFSLCRDRAYSVIGQPPGFPGGGIYFLAYHITGTREVEQIRDLGGVGWCNAVNVHGRHYDMLCSGAFSGGKTLSSNVQTNIVFGEYLNLLKRQKMTLAGNCVRTWIYCRDIDNHYAGMVEARKAIFEREGLLPNTRYIASTGIEGKGVEPNILISMDALAFRGLTPQQIDRLEAPDNMCPTHVYGVTFERGAKLLFGDRTHFHISGTASIDNKGEVLYRNDVGKQTTRALDNVEALLTPHGASLNDMAYFIVYLRNPSELRKVQNALYQRVSEAAPILFVEGAVCRPTWLVEIEGMAITPANGPFPPFL